MRNMIEYPSKSKNYCLHLNDIFFWMISIDIFFLPYLSFVAVSGSVFIVAIWLLINIRKIYVSNEFSLFVIMVIFMVFSTLMNFLYTGNVRFNTTFITAVKRLFQYILCFGTYFFYKDYFLKNNINISKLIFKAIIFMTILAIFFKLFPYKYATIKILINPADNHTRRFLANEVNYRFNYFWTDPNNISYLLGGLTTWIFLQKNVTIIKKFIVLCSSIFIALCTLSNGGIIVIAIMCIIISLYKIIGALKKGIDLKILIEFTLLILLTVFLFEFTDLKDLIKSDYISLFTNRINDYISRDSITGGRLEDLKEAIRYLSPTMLIIGTGNEGFVTENGHIYWIGMYGIPAYCIFMWLMFRKERYQGFMQYIWVVPFFVAFTMNIAIGEYKWLAIYLMLLAYSRYGSCDCCSD